MKARAASETGPGSRSEPAISWRRPFGSRGDLRDLQRTVNPAFEEAEAPPCCHRPGPLQIRWLDIPDLARKSFKLTFRILADRVNGFQIGTNRHDFQTSNSLKQIKPMGTDVGDSTQSTIFFQHTPVVIGRIEETGLNVAAIDGIDTPSSPVRIRPAGLDIQRIVTNVIVDIYNPFVLSYQIDLGGWVSTSGFSPGTYLPTWSASDAYSK